MGSSLKKDPKKLDQLTDIDMLLMVEKGIRGRICHSVGWCIKANNECMKDYDKNKKCNNLYEWAVSQSLPLDGFKWVENTS